MNDPKYLDGAGLKYIWQKTTTYVEQSINQVKSELSSVYRPKGTINTYSELKSLPIESLKVGDVYNVKKSGMNYLWTGEVEDPSYDDGWDALGGLIEIPALTIDEIDKLLAEE